MKMMDKIMRRVKCVMAVALFGVLSGACYVPMPSVGVKPTRVYHVETCVKTAAGTLKCTHTRKWAK